MTGALSGGPDNLLVRVRERGIASAQEVTRIWTYPSFPNLLPSAGVWERNCPRNSIAHPLVPTLKGLNQTT
jgi:hypothetical protein